MVVGREVRIVGTINSSSTGPGYTLLESVKGSEKKEPMVIGYYQDCPYQSLRKKSTTHINNDHEEDIIQADNIDIPEEPYAMQRVVQNFNTDTEGLLVEPDEESDYNPTQGTSYQTEDEETFNCKQCRIPFKFKMSLTYHMKKNHTGSFYCTLCSCKFISFTKIIQIGKR